MFEIGIVGAKNAGKTTLVEKLVRLLVTDGYQVATIKNSAHRHFFDQPGKDSDRHRQAGAGVTLALSPYELALFGSADPDLTEEIRQIIERRFDICIVEGDKRADRPKILLTRNIEKLGKWLPDNVIATYGVQGNIIKDRDIPHFHTNDIDPLAVFIRENVTIANRELISLDG